MLFQKDIQYYKFCAYGFFKNLRFFDAFLLLFFIEKGLSYAQIGILYAFREVVINLFEVLSGIIADVLGRKRAMIGAFVMYLFSFLMFYGFAHFIGFIVAFLFFGLADAFRTGTHKAMILAYLKKHNWQDAKTVYYGRTRSWSQRGSAISALIGAVFVFYTGNYSLVFLLSMVPYFIDLVLLSTYPNYLNGETKGELKGLFLLVKNNIVQLILALKQRAAIQTIILSSNFTGYYKASRDYLQIIIAHTALVYPLFTHVDEEQNAAVYIGLIYFLLYALGSLAARKAYILEKKFASSDKALIRIQGFGWIIGILAGVCYINEYYFAAIFLFSLILIIQNIRRPISVKFVSSQFDDKIMASILSVESQSETIFAAIMALMLGFMVEFIGLGWGICVLSVLLISVSTLTLKKMK